MCRRTGFVESGGEGRRRNEEDELSVLIVLFKLLLIIFLIPTLPLTVVAREGHVTKKWTEVSIPSIFANLLKFEGFNARIFNSGGTMRFRYMFRGH